MTQDAPWGITEPHAGPAGLLPGIFWQLGTLGIAAPGVTGKSLAAAEAGEHEEPW